MSPNRLILAVPLLVVIATAQQQSTAADPCGWRAAKWGMTEQEILKAFDGEAVVLAKPDSYGDAVAPIGIDHLRMTGQDFKVRFMLDSKTKRLFRVSIRPQDHDTEMSITNALFGFLEDMLVPKYGAPAYASTEPPGLGPEAYTRSRKIIWVFPSTTVMLSSETSVIPPGIKKLTATVALDYRDVKYGDIDKF